MQTPSKNICCGILCTCFCCLLQAQNIKKSPFIVHGGISTSGTFYTSNESDTFKTRPHYAWNIYGSFAPKINKFSFPFSFVINDYSRNSKPTYIQMGISPTYKWAKLHLGTRYIRFSPLIYDGQSFTGAGIELNPKSFRLAAFYGRLSKAISIDSVQKNIPRYSRIAYGAKIGIGSASNFIDLIYFHAKDDSSSVSFTNNDTIVDPQENTVLGSSFKLTFFKKLIFTGDIAASGWTPNLSADSITSDTTNYKKLVNFVSNFMTVNISSLASFAGQSTLSFYSRYFNASFNYRRVQPNFNSLGTPYLINDIELFSLTNNFSVAKGRLNINSGISQQHNNLDKKSNTELKTWVSNIGVNAILSKHLNLNLNYFGYNQNQKVNVNTTLSDSALVQQSISQFSATASYNLTKESKLHFISGNLNLSSVNNKNVLLAPQTNSNNLSASIGYSLGFIKKSYSFSVNGLYNRYKQESTNYRSYGANVGSVISLLKEKNLSLQGNVGYYYSSFILAAGTKSNSSNFTYSLNTGYTAKRHSFNLFFNYLYTPPKLINDEINKVFHYAAAFKSFTGSISYAYRL
ncbi:hypothetical protein FC093_01720 [Ilyomonas limi]|uniref:Outer membrane protein beta-barrel domain-containing protein n=1 Tax=Ilyomonas limi TaxID=2575867 RepID=A0A4U3LCG5_9BACT|nr:hypothetical protein [Ilyomonas limi]TKK71766.1 hypothetical protein FC093_01720 [Ilyomonas limi]